MLLCLYILFIFKRVQLSAKWLTCTSVQLKTTELSTDHNCTLVIDCRDMITVGGLKPHWFEKILLKKIKGTDSELVVLERFIAWAGPEPELISKLLDSRVFRSQWKLSGYMLLNRWFIFLSYTCSTHIISFKIVFMNSVIHELVFWTMKYKTFLPDLSLTTLLH